MNHPILTIVVPCYNEEDVLHETFRQLTAILDTMIKRKLISGMSSLLFVDDGSKDGTWDLIQIEGISNPKVKGMKLAGNVGHQNALLAGLEAAASQADCTVSIDADLQDDILAIPSMVEKFHQGYDIVYGVRDKRHTDTIFKRNTALGFYLLMNKLSVKLIPNHADFRLLSRRAMQELMKYKERNLFLRGIIPLIGFPSTTVTYNRLERTAGESKYPLKKMISFAMEGITSFSIAPIRFVTYVGMLTLLLSILALSYIVIQKMLGNTQTGWSSIMISIWIIGGLQLVGIGVVGEYIGKIFKEVKMRPRYSIDMNSYVNEELEQEQTEKKDCKSKS